MNPKEIKRLKRDERSILAAAGITDRMLTSPRLLGVSVVKEWPKKPLSESERATVSLIQDRLSLILRRAWEADKQGAYIGFETEYFEKTLNYLSDILERG